MSDLIICAGMPRSGSTLQFRIIKEILEIEGNSINLGWLKNQDLNQTLQANKGKRIFLKTHIYNSVFKSIAESHEVKVYLTYRDIRDIFVSLMHFTNSPFEEVFSRYKLDQIFCDFNNWKSFESVYIGKYENFIQSIEIEIKNIASSLNIKLTASSVNKIKDKVTDTTIQLDGSSIYDHKNLLHQNHVYSGTINQWEKELSPLQIGIIQFYAKDYFQKYNYKRYRTFYNYSICWRIAKVINHLLNGTLLDRIKDNFHKKQKLIHAFKESSNDKITAKLNSSVEINLYKDSHLSELILSDHFEKNEIIFLSKFLRKGDTFIDIGSNIGLYTLIASPIVSNNGSVIAIEPHTKSYERLIENIELNNLRNVKTINVAVSDIESKKFLYIDKSGYDAWNSLGKPSSGIFIDKEIVITKRLDTIINESSLMNAKLIKIDVEGWEYPVLKGGVNLLSKKDAPVLMVEFTEENAINAGYNCKDVYEIGILYGYKWYKYSMNANDLIPVENKNSYTYQNLLAIKDLNFVKQRLQ